MWDGNGAMEHSNPIPLDSNTSKDLTNTKLAKNQLVSRPKIMNPSGGTGTYGVAADEKVLHQQIESLRRTVDRQNEMLALLMSSMNVSSPNGQAEEQSRAVFTDGPGRKSIDKDGEQFTVGDSDAEGAGPVE
jgi:hypothetical protein